MSGPTRRGVWAPGERVTALAVMGGVTDGFWIEQELGWTGVVALDGGGVELALTGADGRPVTGMAATARLSRPATDRLDAELALSEVRPGRYAAAAPRLPAGAWIADVAVMRPDGEPDGQTVWRTRQRLWLKPQR